MARLFGAERLVLRAVQDLSNDVAGFVTDSQLCKSTNITLKNVRDWIEVLEGEELVEVARTTAGLSARITAKGRLQLNLYQPFAPMQHGADGAGARGPVPSSAFSMPATPWGLSVRGMTPIKWLLASIALLCLFILARTYIPLPGVSGSSHAPGETRAASANSTHLDPDRAITNEGTNPGPAINREKTKTAIKEHFEHPLGAPEGNQTPSIGENHLKQAIFLSLPACNNDLEVMRQALLDLDEVKYFVSNGYDDVHLQSVIEQLKNVREARSLWLRETVKPELTSSQRSSADILLPRYALIDYSQQTPPAVHMTLSDVMKELGKAD